jgi:hypothetical protein
LVVCWHCYLVVPWNSLPLEGKNSWSSIVCRNLPKGVALVNLLATHVFLG